MFLSGGLDSERSGSADDENPARTDRDFFRRLRRAAVTVNCRFARTVAAHIQVETSRGDRRRGRIFLAHSRKLIWHEDEPIAWPSSVSLYFVAKLARESVVVVLTGEGSDETLAGYTRYAFTLKNAALDRVYRGVVPSAVRRGLRNVVATSSLLGATLRRKLEHTFSGTGRRRRGTRSISTISFPRLARTNRPAC